MCGIVGFAAAEGVRPPALGPGLAALHHRGPDANGEWRDERVALGHTRLSIIDLSPHGAQPMASPDGRYVITFNGEIYNFPAIRAELEAAGERFAGHSDTEILLRAYQRYGAEKCLEKLHGMFAFGVWDCREETLFLARDRLGVKPLVYADSREGFVFASEIAALLAVHPAIPRTPDHGALDHYLTYQYIPAPMTAFAAIRKLPPGHAAWIRQGRLEKVWRWWRLTPAPGPAPSFDEACEGLRELVLDATRTRLVSDVPLGAFLSGGIDSSITVAAMSRLTSQPVKTFSIGFDDERFNELPYAREVARHLGTDHHEMMVHADSAAILPRIIGHFGEPHADSSAIPTFAVAQFTRQQVTVALTGDGGDESFAGYRRFYHAGLMERLDRSGLMPLWRLGRRLSVGLENSGRRLRGRPVQAYPASRADQALNLAGADRYKHLLAYFTDAEKAALYRHAGSPGATADILARHLADAAGLEPLNRFLYLDLHTYLPEDVLAKVDICSMANALECRSPFLDHRIVEYAMSLPGHYKLGFPHRHKRLLKEAFKDWLPAGFMERRKMGFSAPVGRWLRTDLAPLVRERLCEQKILSAWFDGAAIERMVEEHLSQRANHAKRIWALLVLAEWKATFAVAD